MSGKITHLLMAPIAQLDRAPVSEAGVPIGRCEHFFVYCGSIAD